MNIPETLFTIIESTRCPLYQLGDRFHLSGRALTPPPGKQVCMVLTDDIKEAVRVCEGPDGNYDASCPVYRFNCNGPRTSCVGVIRLEYRLGDALENEVVDSEREEKVRMMTTVLARFPIFQGLDEAQLQKLGSFLKFRQAEKGDVIIKRGDPGINLYIMASGKISVMGDGELCITYLEKGEVFGEMSLISGDPVAATIRVVEPTKLLYIKGKDFGEILTHFPTMQLYFARLLAKRLAENNRARLREFSSGMTGKLADVNPSEVFQAMNINQKTGVIELAFDDGPARACFREGELVHAEFDHKTGKEAFFEILKRTDGRFQYRPELGATESGLKSLGDFMFLLMEGARKIDEEKTP